MNMHLVPFEEGLHARHNELREHPGFPSPSTACWRDNGVLSGDPVAGCSLASRAAA